MSPDIVNGIFSVAGACFLGNNVRVLMKDKMVRGMSLVSSTFYFGWNVWSLYFYFSLPQWWSFAGQAFTVGAFAVYLSLLVYYRRKEQQGNDRQSFAELAKAITTKESARKIAHAMSPRRSVLGGDIHVRHGGSSRRLFRI